MAAIGVFSAVVIVAVIFGFLFFLYYFLLGMWIRTIAAGVPLSIVTLIRMRLMGIQLSVIVTNLVRARKAGLALTVDEMQSHYLAGGRVEKVTLAMIAAQRAQIPLEWRRAAAIDLAGRDVLEALQTSVTPRVIETPVFQGVAQNGIQLNVKARITVRSNLDRYVGGAGEPTRPRTTAARSATRARTSPAPTRRPGRTAIRRTAARRRARSRAPRT